MQTMFVELFLTIGVKPQNLECSLQCPSYQGISTLIKQCFFLSGVYWEFGAKIVEIKVMEINAPLNLRRGKR